MPRSRRSTSRVVPATHGRKEVHPDPAFEIDLSDALKENHDSAQLDDLYRLYSKGTSYVDALMRRSALRALCKQFGMDVTVEPNVGFMHPETMTIGNGVFIGEQAILQGRHDGHCVIGDFTWIGPQSFFDARDLELGSYVGWGPGARVLGSTHTGMPSDIPIIQTELEIASIRVGDWADIGVNAVILPGVEIGKGAIIGAGAVVKKDVPKFAVEDGLPAQVIDHRDPELLE